MILGVHHASITTKDLSRLVAFYRDVIGFTVVMESSWDSGNAGADAIFGLRDTAVHMAMLRHGNLFLELFAFDNPEGPPGDPQRPVNAPGWTHICLNVRDIELEYARLSAAGVPFTTPPRTAAGLCTATYGRDPDGNIIELMEPDPAGPFAM